MDIFLNICIGIVIVIGFFVFWGRSNGWFKKGGFVYEWWKEKRKKNTPTKK